LRPLSLRLTVAAVAVLGALASPVLAGGKVVTQTKTVNLDDDPQLEKVVPQEVCVPPAGRAAAADCPPGDFPQRHIEIQDTCGGAPYASVISSEQDFVQTLKVSNFEPITRRPEIFFDLRSGAGGRVGEIRLVSWEDTANPTACREPRDLFLYPSRRTLGRLPRHAKSHDTFAATLRNHTKRYPGKEVRLVETYVDRNDAFCCPSFERVTWFGYKASKDRYVRIATRIKRIKTR
jgi:hypothetical protein